MKKFTLLFILFTFLGVSYAEELSTSVDTSADKSGFFERKLQKAGKSMDKSVDIMDNKIKEQQVKFDKTKAKYDAKIEEKQAELEKSLNMHQKRLEKKREQLKQLLDE